MTKLEKPAPPPALTHDALQTLRRELSAMTPQKRLEAILSRKDTLKVVRALPALDLYATVRDVGLEDCLELLELTSPRQVQAFLDLDGWRGDRIDSHAISNWLRALFAANPDRATGQLRGLDLELLTLLMKVHTRVFDLAAEEEPGDDVGMHTITPDRHYLIAYGGIAEDEQMQHVLKEGIERLLGRDIMFVLRLCEAVRWELPSSLEETALRWRDGRMADLGFLPRHEALEMFAYLDPDGTLPDVPLANRAAPFSARDDEAVSTDLSTSVVLPWDVLSDGQKAFGQALATLPELARERVTHELMLVANRVHCADAGDTGDTAALTQTARQVVDTIGTALAYRAKGDPQRMPDVLGRVPLISLFRVGHSLLIKLARELSRIVNTKDSGLDGEGLLRLDTPLREVAAGLLRPRALLFAGLVDARRADYRPPTSLAELAAAAGAVKEIAFRGALFSARGLGVPPPAADPAEVPSHAALLGTVLARVLLNAAPDALALTPLGANHLFALRDALKDAARVQAGVDALVARIAALPLTGAGEGLEARARAYVAQVAGALASEVGGVQGAEVDARFVASLWAK